MTVTTISAQLRTPISHDTISLLAGYGSRLRAVWQCGVCTTGQEQSARCACRLSRRCGKFSVKKPAESTPHFVLSRVRIGPPQGALAGPLFCAQAQAIDAQHRYDDRHRQVTTTQPTAVTHTASRIRDPPTIRDLGARRCAAPGSREPSPVGLGHPASIPWRVHCATPNAAGQSCASRLRDKLIV